MCASALGAAPARRACRSTALGRKAPGAAAGTGDSRLSAPAGPFWAAWAGTGGGAACLGGGAGILVPPSGGMGGGCGGGAFALPPAAPAPAHPPVAGKEILALLESLSKQAVPMGKQVRITAVCYLSKHACNAKSFNNSSCGASSATELRKIVLPTNREPFAGMGGGAGGGAAERGAPRDGLRALRGVFSFCATAAAAASAPSHSVCSIVFISASPRGMRWVWAFLLICNQHWRLEILIS